MRKLFNLGLAMICCFQQTCLGVIRPENEQIGRDITCQAELLFIICNFTSSDLAVRPKGSGDYSVLPKDIDSDPKIKELWYNAKESCVPAKRYPRDYIYKISRNDYIAFNYVGEVNFGTIYCGLFGIEVEVESFDICFEYCDKVGGPYGKYYDIELFPTYAGDCDLKVLAIFSKSISRYHYSPAISTIFIIDRNNEAPMREVCKIFRVPYSEKALVKRYKYPDAFRKIEKEPYCNSDKCNLL